MVVLISAGGGGLTFLFWAHQSAFWPAIPKGFWGESPAGLWVNGAWLWISWTSDGGAVDRLVFRGIFSVVWVESFSSN